MNNPSFFHPLIADWFRERLGEPTEIQARAWPVIRAGENALVIAPTGCGKTLAAFLCALDRLIRGELPRGETSILYVSPLKALNNDVRRNLLAPLGELAERFQAAGTPFAPIRVETRSGDTSQADRRRMLRRPPEILITTPESLNLLLSSHGGRGLLGGVSCVILDEIHAVLGEKRGTHLITAVDRLVPLCGEFQRLALSATVKPEDEAAAFVAGRVLTGPAQAPEYLPRPMRIIRSEAEKRYDIRVRFPDEAADRPQNESLWAPLVDAFRETIARNKTTLFFVNGRRLCEKLAHKINGSEAGRLVYAHHGSLSREIRASVEEKLKTGELPAVIATNSLELGIDVGHVDEAVLIQCPPSVASAVQRIGRAGHGVGEVSKGTLFPTHGKDFLESAALVKAALARDIEETRPVAAPLDVLAQLIVSMVLTETFDVDALYACIRASYPYRNLPRGHFDLTLAMLAGRYAETRIRELRPKVLVDALDNTVAAARGAAMDLYSSGGVIPDRGYYAIRHAQTGARIGDLDEVFVWEAKVGQAFAFGAQHWKIERITHNDVLVSPAPPLIKDAPFWIGEQRGRDFHFSERLGRFLEEADERLDDPGFPEELRRVCGMEPGAAAALIGFLSSQKKATKTGLPHRHRLVLERTSSGPGGAAGGSQIALHAPWGLRLTRPYALALDAAYEERFGERPRIYAANDVIALVLPHEISSEEFFSLVTASRLEELLRLRLEGSGVFGAAFREAAGRALLLPRRSFGERMPLWMSRLRSQKLLEAVSGTGDFPLMIEAWRTCLRETFDMESLGRMLGELEDGLITRVETRTATPSPMAREIAWRQITDEFMYMTDEARHDAPSRLRPDLLAEVVFRPGLRPAVLPEVAAVFEDKRRRTYPGYAPSGPEELLDWARERILIPLPEWLALGRAMVRDHGLSLDEMEAALAGKLARMAPHGAAGPLVAAVERLPLIVSAFYPGERDMPVSPEGMGATQACGRTALDAEARAGLAGEWLSYYGPRPSGFLAETLGLDPEDAGLLLEDLAEARRIVAGELVAGQDEELVCEARNFEILLRMARAAARPSFEPLPLARLQSFLAERQGLCPRGGDGDELYDRLERLFFAPLRAAALESEIIPARMRGTRGDDPGFLDETLRESGLMWLGCGPKKIVLAHRDDLDLLDAPTEPGALEREEDAGTLARLFPDRRGRYDFSALLEISGLRPGALSDLLWELVWKGRVGNDAFAALRRGVMNGFKVPALAEAPRGGRRLRGMRAARTKWSGALPYAGAWFRLPEPDAVAGEACDPLDEAEAARDRARIVLCRYGVVFRELLARESAAFSFGALFRAFRLMELSGEVLAGYFFEGVPGPQFAAPEAVSALLRKPASGAVWWMAATDPASLCGVSLPGLAGTLPRRSAGTLLAFRGETLALVCEAGGKRLRILVPPDDPDLRHFFEPLRSLLERRFRPARRIGLETVNGVPPGESAYLPALRARFEVLLDHKGATLYAGPEATERTGF